jgi:hypothetical protein
MGLAMNIIPRTIIKKILYGICGCIVLTAVIVGFLYVQKVRDRALCIGQLKAIYAALSVYYDELNHLPDYNKWYDQIIKETDFYPGSLKCPSEKKSSEVFGNYFINKYFPSNWKAPIDMVLVFEGDRGWNQVGDKTQIIYHHGGESNVLLSTGEIVIVKKANVDSLRWEP